MVIAVRELEKEGGGVITVDNGEKLAFIKLPLAGLMSIEKPETVAEEIEKTYEVWRERGCRWISPFMTISLLALDVLPELRITEKGLIDTINYKPVSLLQ
jgi:adenine deaminase